MSAKAFLLIAVMPFSSMASSVAWNAFYLDSSFGGEDWILDGCDFRWRDYSPYVLFSIQVTGSKFKLTSDDLSETLSPFVGNWIVGKEGDVADALTTRNQGTYFNHCKIDGENAKMKPISGTLGDDFYLLFAVENLDDYEKSLPDPRVLYGWAHLGVTEDGAVELYASAIGLDGQAMVVGTIPEPSSALLLLMGIAGLALRRLGTRERGDLV